MKFIFNKAAGFCFMLLQENYISENVLRQISGTFAPEIWRQRFEKYPFFLWIVTYQ